MPSLKLTVRYASKLVNLTDCLSFRLTKDRYTPYTELSGRWYCPSDMAENEVFMVIFYIDNVIRHYGYPTDIRITRENGRTILSVASRSHASALLVNQCPDGMLTDINLTTLAAQSWKLPLIVYEPNTPTVNYVNYYNGTCMWDAIVCYAMRATGVYPYISGYNTLKVTKPASPKQITTTSARLISRSNKTDYSKLLSRVSMKDIDGTQDAYVATNGVTTSRMMTRCREENFDREWIMDPDRGTLFKIYNSTRGMYSDSFAYLGYDAPDLLDSFSVSDLGFSGEIDRLVFSATPEKGFVTEIGCYKDEFCPAGGFPI